MDEIEIRKLETAVSIVQSTIQNGIYQEVAFKAEPSWGSLLSEYSLAFKQLDSVWSDINPVFQLYELIPLKPTEFPPEIPALLSTNIPTEDVEANIEPKMEYTSSRQDIEAVVEHNQQIKRILASYSEKAAPLMRNKRQKIDNRAKIFNPDFVKEQLSSFR